MIEAPPKVDTHRPRPEDSHRKAIMLAHALRISIIIPVWNEQSSLPATLESVKALKPDELIVVDGGSADRSREIAARAGAMTLCAPKGRAVQMNRGAKQARGDVLLFIHADTRLPDSALHDIRSALQDPDLLGGRFDVALDSDRRILRAVGRMISLRSRLTKIATGDQGIFVRRVVWEDLGGFPEIPLMEDVAFSRALKRKGRIACLKSRVVTSARRWEREGVWRTILKMWCLKALYLAGVSPLRLKRYYGDAR